jgi:hypothetical protein
MPVIRFLSFINAIQGHKCGDNSKLGHDFANVFIIAVKICVFAALHFRPSN